MVYTTDLVQISCLSALSETMGVERIKFVETLTVSADGNRERSLLTNSGGNV